MAQIDCISADLICVAFHMASGPLMVLRLEFPRPTSEPARNLMGQANEIRFIKDNVEEGKKDQPHRKTLRVHGQIALINAPLEGKHGLTQSRIIRHQ